MRPSEQPLHVISVELSVGNWPISVKATFSVMVHVTEQFKEGDDCPRMPRLSFVLETHAHGEFCSLFFSCVVEEATYLVIQATKELFEKTLAEGNDGRAYRYGLT